MKMKYFQNEKRQEIRNLLYLFIPTIPPSLNDVERQTYISENFVKMLSIGDRTFIKSYINMLLNEMRELNASDLEMGGGGCNNMIWLRIENKKQPIEELGTYHLDEFNILIQVMLEDHQREFLFLKKSFDYSYSIKGENDKFIRYRACAYFELGYLALNIRAINTQIRAYESYKFHPAITKMLSLIYTKEGLILITGITGSGKSTTLDAIIDLNNRACSGHIVIISRPIEFIHQSYKSIVRHREVGLDTLSFKHGTIEALRQDPDIIVIGEMRDPETIRTALEAADSGHKVFSTLHTYSAVESIERIIGEVPRLEQDRIRNRLADILRCVISQRLIPRKHGGLVMAKEILIMTSSVNAAIKNENIPEIYQMITEGGKLGMSTLEQDLRQLFQAGEITWNTAINFANNKQRMKQLLAI